MKKGLLWSRLNSAAAAIISSLISMMTKLVPDIKTGQWRRDTYGLFIFPANDTGGCLSVPICSLQPLPHACGSQQSPQGSRQARQGPGKGFFCVSICSFWGNLPWLCLGSPGQPPSWGYGGSTVPQTAVCMDICPSLGTHSNVVAFRVITSFVWPVITKMGNCISGEKLNKKGSCK